MAHSTLPPPYYPQGALDRSGSFAYLHRKTSRLLSNHFEHPPHLGPHRIYYLIRVVTHSIPISNSLAKYNDYLIYLYFSFSYFLVFFFPRPHPHGGDLPSLPLARAKPFIESLRWKVWGLGFSWTSYLLDWSFANTNQIVVFLIGKATCWRDVYLLEYGDKMLDLCEHW